MMEQSKLNERVEELKNLDQANFEEEIRSDSIIKPVRIEFSGWQNFMINKKNFMKFGKFHDRICTISLRIFGFIKIEFKINVKS